MSAHEDDRDEHFRLQKPFLPDYLTVENPTPGVLRAADVLFRADSTDAVCYGWVPQAKETLAAALDVEEMAAVLLVRWQSHAADGTRMTAEGFTCDMAEYLRAWILGADQ